MALKWGARRKLLYSFVGILIAIVALYFIYQAFLTTPPSCHNGVQDQDELGVDCGGNICTLVCADSARAPIVRWARAFQSAPGVYTAAAFVENHNTGAGSKNVRYSFQLFDADNLLVVERDGVVNLPPVQNIPVVETNIAAGNRTVSRAFFSFSEVPTWNKIASGTVTPLSVTNQMLSQDGTELSATLVNNSVQDAHNVLVTAVLYDSAGVARAASKSQFPTVSRKSTQNVIFTWPTPTPDVFRAEITILPSF